MAEPSRVDDPPDMSVVISTYNRAHLLPGLFEGLAAQSIPPSRFELAIVDNGSRDDTPRVLAELAARSQFRVRTDRLEQNRGPAVGRNRAVELAEGTWLAFTDDDCTPTPGWLAAGLVALESGANVVVGKTLPEEPAKGPFSRTLRVTSVRWFPTANIFYRRSDVTAVGGFDPAFRTPGGEDTDLAWRILEDQPDRAVFASDALVVHPTSENRFPAAARLAWRWSDIPLFYRRHPSARSTHAHWRVFWKPTHVGGVVSAVGILGSLVWWPLLGLVGVHAWQRLVRRPATPSRRRRVVTLPGVMAIDMIELAALIRGSLRHRTLFL